MADSAEAFNFVIAPTCLQAGLGAQRSLGRLTRMEVETIGGERSLANTANCSESRLDWQELLGLWNEVRLAPPLSTVRGRYNG